MPAWNRSREEEERGRALRAELLTTDLRDSALGPDHGDRDGCERRGAGSTGGARTAGGGRRRAGGQRGGGDRIGLTPRCPQEEEFRWLLHAEVHAVLRQLQDILKVTHRPVPPGLPSFLSTGSANRATATAERSQFR